MTVRKTTIRKGCTMNGHWIAGRMYWYGDGSAGDMCSVQTLANRPWALFPTPAIWHVTQTDPAFWLGLYSDWQNGQRMTLSPERALRPAVSIFTGSDGSKDSGDASVSFWSQCRATCFNLSTAASRLRGSR